MSAPSLCSFLLVALVFSVPAFGAQPSTLSERQTIDEIAYELSRLSSYGVFDSLAFESAKGTVTLSGFAYSSTLPRDAVRAVKRVPGVDEVVDRIERLPASMHDDDIRRATFYEVYADPVLSRYAPQHGQRLDEEIYYLLRFPGTQPLGRYGIHIVVQRGRTLLVGAVDTEADKRLATMRARSVSGVFEVTNDLVVED